MLDSSAALPSSSSLLLVLATASSVNAAYLVKSFRLDCLLFGCWFSPSYATRSGGRWRRRGNNHGTRSCLQTRHPDERTNQVRKLPHILSLCLSFFVTTYGCSRIQWPVFATSCVCSEPFSWLLATWICRESVSRHKSDNGLCNGSLSLSVCNISLPLPLSLWVQTCEHLLFYARQEWARSTQKTHLMIKFVKKQKETLWKQLGQTNKQINKATLVGVGYPLNPWNLVRWVDEGSWQQ